MSDETSPAEFFTHDHRTCDALWAQVEEAVEEGDGPGALEAFRFFDEALRRHLCMEEDELFPALERAGLPAQGPTAVMRHEHEQMRAILDRMRHHAAAQEHEDIADEGDTLLMLIQQHNAKEEGILYPMADRLLGPAWPALAARLDRY